MTGQKTSFLAANKDLLMIAGLGLLVVIIYAQTTRFDFINLDDNLYVYSNSALLNGLTWEAVKWAFTSFWSANWHPLTWLSHGLDIQLFGLAAGSHHAVNVVLHLINTILVLVVFRRMTGQEWPSLIVAALFAVHPAHVESVAWISERKDVLSTMFWLLTMFGYVNYSRQSVEKGGNSSFRFVRPLSLNYWLVVIAFALGLMAKPMLVTLPFVLLLCDFWPLERLRSLRDIIPRVIEKLPLFALSAASCVITYVAQRSIGAVESLNNLPLETRFLNAFVSYAKYILMLFYPADLAVFYPYDKEIPSWQIGGSVILLSVVTAICIRQVRKRPFLMMGWLWYLGTLVPVIGILQVGSQALADRYTYIPYLGLFVMIVWGARSFADEGAFGKQAFRFASAFAVLVLTGFAMHQVWYWRDSERLYRHTLSVTTDNYIIDHNLCHYYLVNERLDEAEPLCQKAIDIKPTYSEPYNTLGIIEFKQGKFEDAEYNFQRSLEYGPGYVFALINLAQVQARLDKPDEAEETLRQAVESNGGVPNDSFAPALNFVAASFFDRQNYQKAADNFARLVYLEPNNADAQVRLAICLYDLKRYDEAETAARNAVAVKADLADAWYTLGLVLVEKKQDVQAAEAFVSALRLKPDFSEAQAKLDMVNSRSESSTKK